MPDESTMASTMGPNAWLVDEMYEQYLADPTSVSESWQDFFADYRPTTDQRRAAAAAADGACRGTRRRPPRPRRPRRRRPPAPAAATAPRAEPEGEPLRGAAARIVANMEASLGVPTATQLPRGPGQAARGQPQGHQRLPRPHPRRQGQLHPPHRLRRRAGHRRRRAGHERHLRRGRRRQAAASCATSTSASASPSTSRSPTAAARCSCRHQATPTRSTSAASGPPTRTSSARSASTSSPPTTSPAPPSRSPTRAPSARCSRCPGSCPARASIVGVGTLDYPAEFQGADPQTLADLGVSKVMTITSTYDHRIIQGAESGLFLKRVHELLHGRATTSTTTSSARSACPTRPVQWRRDVNPVDREQSHAREADAGADAHQHAPGARPPHRRPRPAGVPKEPHMHAELDPATYGLTIWDLDREFLTGGLAGTRRA